MKITPNTQTTDQAQETRSRSHVHTMHESNKGERTSENARSRNTQVSAEEAGSARPEISAQGRDFAKAKEVATSAPDVREEKIAKLKAMIAANQYKVDPKAVADRMVDEHLSSGIG